MFVFRRTLQLMRMEWTQKNNDLRRAIMYRDELLKQKDSEIDKLKVEITDLHLKNAELKEKLSKSKDWMTELLEIIDAHFETLQPRDLTPTDAGSSGSEGEVSEVSDSGSEDVHTESGGT